MKMESVGKTESQNYALDLLSGDTFEIRFITENQIQPNGGENILSLVDIGLPMQDMHSLIDQIEGYTEDDLQLQVLILKTLADRRFCTQYPIYLDLSFGAKTAATAKIAITGEFFDEFLSHCKVPVKLKFAMEINLEDNTVLTLVSREMWPSLVKLPKERLTLIVFEDELELKVNPIFQTNKSYTARIKMEIIHVRKVELTSLPCSNTIGQRILESEIQSDFEIISKNDTKFKCHTAFLAINSPAFASMFQMKCKETTEKAVKLELTEEGVRALLKFMYYADLEDPSKNLGLAIELLAFADEKDIVVLGQAMKDLLCLRRSDEFDIDSAILLYLKTLKIDGLRDLMLKALHAIKSNPQDLTESFSYKQLMEDDPTTGTLMISLCLQL